MFYVTADKLEFDIYTLGCWPIFNIDIGICY